jgi:hypothetical protein
MVLNRKLSQQAMVSGRGTGQMRRVELKSAAMSLLYVLESGNLLNQSIWGISKPVMR